MDESPRCLRIKSLLRGQLKDKMLPKRYSKSGSAWVLCHGDDGAIACFTEFGLTKRTVVNLTLSHQSCDIYAYLGFNDACLPVFRPKSP